VVGEPRYDIDIIGQDSRSILLFSRK